MGSKKERTDKKLKKYIGNSSNMSQHNKVLPKTSKSSDNTINLMPQTPLYTALIMIICIFVISFLFTFMMNTVITEICIKQDPTLSNNIEALRAAAEKYLTEHPIFNIINKILVNMAGISAIMIFFRKLEKTELPVIGFINNGKRKMDIGMGILFSFCAVLVAYNILAFFGFIKPTFALVFNPIQLLWTLDIIIMCVFEEMLFRGYMIFKLKKQNTLLRIAIPTILFALYKGLPSTMPSTYITYIAMGAYLSFTAIRFNSIWFSVAFRAIWTFTSGILLSIYSMAVPGIIENENIATNILSGSPAGFENGLIATFVIVICFAITQYMLKKRTEKTQRRLYPDGTIR